MKASYLSAATVAEVIDLLGSLGVRTVVFDVEPLIAFWDTDQAALAAGIADVLDRLKAVGPDAVVFATNSTRTPETAPFVGRTNVIYRAAAAKPFRTAAYQRLPRPGVVIGDQVATDGVLAWRLRYTFIHYQPTLAVPLGPRLMRHLGRPMVPLLFKRHPATR